MNDYEDKIEESADIHSYVDVSAETLINRANVKAQDCLNKDDMKQGFMQYRQYIEYIEVLARAKHILPEDYDKKVKEFTEKIEETNMLIRSTKIANYKLLLLMEEMFYEKSSDEPMKA